MKADTLTLKQVFSKDIRYIVPMFQRPYVWTRAKHWEPLWEDVRTTTERLMRAIASDDTLDATHAEQQTVPHFLGAIVVDQLPTGAAHVEARHIIDGQQRLTTLQLLLDAVQEVTAQDGTARDARLLSKLILNDPDVVTQADHRFKVWPTNIDRNAFRAAMDDDLDRTAHHGTAIADAHRFFAQEASEWINDGDPETRGTALSTALHGLFQLVVIDLEPHDNAQVIFETLNARGTPLLAADLVKNHVMQTAVSQGLDAEALYLEQWSAFDSAHWRHEVKQGRLTRPRIDSFLDYWLEMQSGVEVPAHDVFPSFRRHLRDADQDVVGVVEELARDGAVFEQLHGPRDHSPEGTFLYRWDILEAQVLTPLLMWLFAQPEAELPREQLQLALTSMESYLVRRTVVRLTTKNYNMLFLSALGAARAGATCEAGTRVAEFLAGQTADASYWPRDQEFAKALVTEPLYARLKRARLRMILEAIEDRLRTPNTEDEHVTRNKLTIEHLLPQAWTPETWPLPDEDEAVAEAVRRNTMLHSIGNLTLVTDRLNPLLSNGAWSHKRPKIEEHGILRIHNGFKNSAQWGEPEILERSTYLAGIALTVWPRPDGGTVDFDKITATAFRDSTPVPGGSPTGDSTLSLAWMIEEEILEPGDLLVDSMPSKGVTYEAIVAEDGSLMVDTGDVFASPSGAAKHYHERHVNGWRRWRVPRLQNARLSDLRAEFEAPVEGDSEDDDPGT